MFKVDNKTMPMALLVTFTNLTRCSIVSIVNFEHVNAEWGGYIVLTITKGSGNVFMLLSMGDFILDSETSDLCNWEHNYISSPKTSKTELAYTAFTWFHRSTCLVVNNPIAESNWVKFEVVVSNSDCTKRFKLL